MTIKLSLTNNPDVLEAMKLINEFHIMLNCQPFKPTIRIKVYEFITATPIPYQIVFSHLVRTPVQNEPTVPSMSAAVAKVEVENYLELIMSFMNDAIGKGHTPSQDWLIPNPHF